jgi:hypothetical protein
MTEYQEESELKPAIERKKEREREREREREKLQQECKISRSTSITEERSACGTDLAIPREKN